MTILVYLVVSNILFFKGRVFVLDQWVFVLDQWVFVLDHRVFVFDQWVFVLDHRVFVLDHRVFVLDQWVLGLRFWVFVFDTTKHLNLLRDQKKNISKIFSDKYFNGASERTKCFRASSKLSILLDC